MIDDLTRSVLEQRDNIENQRNRELNSNREHYIKQLEQENKQLKLDYKLYKDNCVYRNYEVEIRDNTIKQLKEVIEEVKTEISSLMSKYFYEKDFCIEDIHLDKLLQILDKGVKND